jgi:regulatory protein
MLTFDPIIYDKLLRFCSYQERAISEVKTKMQKLGVIESLYDDYLKELQEDNYQNELRYAEAFASGKMRLKAWGARKVEMHLKQKGVDSSIIRTVLEGSQDDAYMERLKELVEQKLERVKGKDDYERKSKVFRFLQQKGYESDLIHKVLFRD